jgi:hypothetical protein
LRQHRVELRSQYRRVHCHAGPREFAFDRVRGEELAGERPHGGQCGLHAPVRFGRAVAEPDHPLRGVLPVVRDLLDALRADRREDRVA